MPKQKDVQPIFHRPDCVWIGRFLYIKLGGFPMLNANERSRLHTNILGVYRATFSETYELADPGCVRTDAV